MFVNYIQEEMYMKKFGKKALLLVSVGALMALTLTGCGKKMECEGCLEEKMCNEYEVSVLGQSEDMWLCNDCVEELEDEGEEFGVEVEKK